MAEETKLGWITLPWRSGGHCYQAVDPDRSSGLQTVMQTRCARAGG